MTRVFGRTNEAVAAVWREHADGRIDAGAWTGLVIDADELDRRGGDRVRERAKVLGRPFDFAFVRGIAAGDMKVGWPLHRLQRFRDEKLLRFVVIEAIDVLDAEWIAANAPVHGVAVEYSPDNMAARYRVFDAAVNGGVALVGLAATPVDAGLHLATPALTATLVDVSIAEPNLLTVDDVEKMWLKYTENHDEPQKLRGAHPPDFGG